MGQSRNFVVLQAGPCGVPGSGISLRAGGGIGRHRASGEGLAAVDQALERSASSEHRWCTAELLHVKGELVLSEKGPDAAAVAEDHFRQALEWAQRQGALSRELHAATSHARLRRVQGRIREARKLLAPVYDRFTQGFETADLKAAKALIGDLPER
jgi:hypothetical protein